MQLRWWATHPASCSQLQYLPPSTPTSTQPQACPLSLPGCPWFSWCWRGPCFWLCPCPLSLCPEIFLARALTSSKPLLPPHSGRSFQPTCDNVPSLPPRGQDSSPCPDSGGVGVFVCFTEAVSWALVHLWPRVMVFRRFLWHIGASQWHLLWKASFVLEGTDLQYLKWGAESHLLPHLAHERQPPWPWEAYLVGSQPFITRHTFLTQLHPLCALVAHAHWWFLNSLLLIFSWTSICIFPERLPNPVFWPGESRGLYSPWGCKESDTTEQLSHSPLLEFTTCLEWHLIILLAMPTLIPFTFSVSYFLCMLIGFQEILELLPESFCNLNSACPASHPS